MNCPETMLVMCLGMTQQAAEGNLNHGTLAVLIILSWFATSMIIVTSLTKPGAEQQGLLRI